MSSETIVFRYDGLVYKNINPSTFNESELYYINKKFKNYKGLAYKEPTAHTV